MLETPQQGEPKKEMFGAQPSRTGQFAKVAMAIFLLFSSATERINAQNQNRDPVARGGDIKEQGLEDYKADFPTSLVKERTAVENIFDECRKLQKVASEEVKNLEKVFADKDVTSEKMREAAVKLLGISHELSMAWIKASSTLLDAQRKRLPLLESFSSKELKSFSIFTSRFSKEWTTIGEGIKEVEKVLSSKDAVMMEKNREELEKIEKELNDSLKKPKQTPPPEKKNA